MYTKINAWFILSLPILFVIHQLHNWHILWYNNECDYNIETQNCLITSYYGCGKRMSLMIPGHGPIMTQEESGNKRAR